MSLHHDISVNMSHSICFVICTTAKLKYALTLSYLVIIHLQNEYYDKA